MAGLRKQDVLSSPAQRRAEHEQQAPVPVEAAGFEQRLAALFARLRDDETALARALSLLGGPEQRTARIVAIRSLGAARARAVCDAAFGAGGGRLAPAVEEARREAESGALPSEAAWELARARGLGEVLELLAGGGGHAERRLAGEVVAAGGARPVGIGTFVAERVGRGPRYWQRQVVSSRRECARSRRGGGKSVGGAQGLLGRKPRMARKTRPQQGSKPFGVLAARPREAWISNRSAF